MGTKNRVTNVVPPLTVTSQQQPSPYNSHFSNIPKSYFTIKLISLFWLCWGLTTHQPINNDWVEFRKLIYHYKIIGYSLNIMRQTAYLVVNLIIVDGYASLFNCTTVVRPQTQWRPLLKTLTSGFGLDHMSLAWPAVVQLLVFIYSGIH